ncbi:PREDICTED: uncharacterized protein LOC109471345 [Branchiostoma belcheri]|uniref:Uncharacterized protein LOC109471345 n=1 Tax=Branchiostoma belcheri TaxID=7741 RepID=A0A6P4YP77_BRABE|nr:PREDICTED: uncharacterized protein LOC109471345 [Branchiostoma belcheri]
MASSYGNEDFAEVLDRTVGRYGSLSIIVVQLQQLTGGGRGFRDVLSSYKAMPEWSSEEASNFRHMMGLIKDACTSFGKVEEAARAYVLRTKEFAKENLEFAEDVQEGLGPEDLEDLLADWVASIDEMKESNGKIEIVKDEFENVLGKLETAQGHAASGKSSGKRDAEEASRNSLLYSVGGAVGTAVGGVATIATGGLAAIPIGAATAAFGGWSFGSAIKSAADSIKGFFYCPVTTSDDSSIQDKYRDWEKAFALAARQLDSAYAFVGKMTDESKKTLNDLSEYSRQLLSRSKKMAKAEKISRIQESKLVQKQFKRLEDESKTVKKACIAYIEKDNEARGITGTMAQLSLEQENLRKPVPQSADHSTPSSFAERTSSGEEAAQSVSYSPLRSDQAREEMDVEEEFIAIFDLTVVRFGGLSGNIGQLQRVIGGNKNFKDVLASYRHVPDMSSEEGRKYRNMMELIEDACNSLDKIAEAQRQYVLRTKEFAKDNIDFISDAQGNLEAEDIRELVSDWKDSIDKMTEYNDKIETVSDRFNRVLRDLRTAQGEAASGKERGRKGERDADRGTAACATGAVGSAGVAAAATVATGGLAAPIIGIGAVVSFGLGALKFASDSICRLFKGPETDDSSIQETHKKWKEAFALVSKQLDDAYGYIKSLTEESKKILTDLSTNSQLLAEKSKKMAKQQKIMRSSRWQSQFTRLGEKSNDVKTACIDYIRKDNSVRGITGTTARLSLE